MSGGDTWDHEESAWSFEAPFEGGRILRERSADAPEPRKQGDDLSPENASEKNGGEGGIARGRRRSSSASLRTVAAALQRPAPMLCVGLLNLKIRTPSLRSAVEKPKGAQGPFCFSYVAERVGFEPTDGTVEINILLENRGLLVPSKPLASPFVPVDSASRRIRCWPVCPFGHRTSD
jgi:hypothetical protein